MLKKIIFVLNIFKNLARLKLAEHKVYKKIIKPSVINLNANDICNSKCTMCNIWKNKIEKEITYEDLKNIFSDPFYSDVKGVGITGGEPTLREDLVELYRACIEFLPNLNGLSIITNCIKVDEVKRQLKLVNDLCIANNISFSVMVSLDGYGETHDIIRGKEGNFESVIEIINFVKEDLKIPVFFGATISKENVWEIDKLLDFAKANKIYGRFRVAEFIKRLYNDDRNEVIRNFTDDESYHLALFFENIKLTYEMSGIYRRTYTSIQNILLGGKRTIGCPYQKDAININAKGELAFCAPKSKIIGNAINQSSEVIYKNNLDEKKRIFVDDCSDCIHDYHASVSFSEQLDDYKKLIYKKILNVESNKKALQLSVFLKNATLPKTKYSILIVGWYGTETVGDKAILGGIVDDYKSKYGENLNIVIGSIYPFITKKTIKELDIQATVISTSNFEFFRYAKACDEVIMGGGPLMDLSHLYIPFHAFSIARKYNKKTIVYGCGLGPIKEPKFKKTINEILKLSVEIKLRDYASQIYAENVFEISETEMTGDPAKDYVVKRAKVIEVKKTKTLSLYLRDWTFEYANHLYSYEKFLEVKLQFERALAKFIKLKASELGIERIKFNHMHNYVVGGDDRDFSRKFIKEYFPHDNRIVYDEKLSTVDSIVQEVKASEMNICMRFHSVLFASVLNTQFLAIDYTLGGKIEGFLKQNNALDNLITIEKLIEAN